MAPKAIGLKKATDMMRSGARLVKMFTHNSNPESTEHYIIPGGYVEPDTAEKLKKREDIVAGEDGLFPGMSQTWRIRA